MFQTISAPQDLNTVWGFPKNLHIKEKSQYNIQLGHQTVHASIKKIFTNLNNMLSNEAELALKFYAEHRYVYKQLYFLRWLEDLTLESIEGQLTIDPMIFEKDVKSRAYFIMMLTLGEKAKVYRKCLQRGTSRHAFERFQNLIESNRKLLLGSGSKAFLYTLTPFKTPRAILNFFDFVYDPKDRAEIKEKEEFPEVSFQFLQFYDLHQVSYVLVPNHQILGGQKLESTVLNPESFNQILNQLKDFLYSPAIDQQFIQTFQKYFGIDVSKYEGWLARTIKDCHPFSFGCFPFSPKKSLKIFERFLQRNKRNLLQLSFNSACEIIHPKLVIASPSLAKWVFTPKETQYTPLSLLMTKIHKICWLPDQALKLKAMQKPFFLLGIKDYSDTSDNRLNIISSWAYTSCGYNANALENFLLSGETSFRIDVLSIHQLARSLQIQLEAQAHSLLLNKNENSLILYKISLGQSENKIGEDYHAEYTGHAFIIIQFYRNGQVYAKRLDAYVGGGTLWGRLLEALVVSDHPQGFLTQNQLDKTFTQKFVALAEASGNGWTNSVIQLYYELFGTNHINRIGLQFSNAENCLTGKFHLTQLNIETLLDKYQQSKHLLENIKIQPYSSKDYTKKFPNQKDGFLITQMSPFDKYLK